MLDINKIERKQFYYKTSAYGFSSSFLYCFPYFSVLKETKSFFFVSFLRSPFLTFFSHVPFSFIPLTFSFCLFLYFEWFIDVFNVPFNIYHTYIVSTIHVIILFRKFPFAFYLSSNFKKNCHTSTYTEREGTRKKKMRDKNKEIKRKKERESKKLGIVK